MEAQAFEKLLSRRLAGATRLAVMGIGDDQNPLDRAGVLAAIMIQELEQPNVTVFLTGTMPENYTGALRELRPSHVLMIDTADMGEAPGTLGVIHPGEIRGQRFSTHAMPLTLVIEYLEEELGATVVLVGIQPDDVAPTEREAPPASEAVTDGIARLRQAFRGATRDLW